MNANESVEARRILRRATMINNLWSGALSAGDQRVFHTEFSTLMHRAYTNEEFAFLANTVDFAMLDETSR